MDSEAASPTTRQPLFGRVIDNVQGTLAGLMPRDQWLVVLAFASGLLTYMATTGGLFIILPWAQSAFVAGIAIGLLAERIRTAAITGAVVGAAGFLLGPPNFYDFLFEFPSRSSSSGNMALLGSMLVCAAVAVVVRLLIARSSKFAGACLTVAVAVLLVAFWFTPITMNGVSSSTSNGVPNPSFNEQLNGDIPKAMAESDPMLFINVYQGMRRGADFYPEYSRVLTRERGAGAESVADFRVPLLFWVWNALPDPASIVFLFLALATAALLSVLMLRRHVSAPLLLPAVAALSSYFLYFSLNIWLFEQEQWAGSLALLALTAHAMSARSAKWRGWTIAAVLFAVLALLVREVAAFALLGGIVSAFLGEREQRKFRVVAWASGGAIAAGLYGAHFLAASPYLTGAEGVPRVGYGNFAFMLAAFDFATSFLGRGGWLPLLLAGLGIVGALLVKDRGVRAFAIIATIAPLAAFLVIGNDAHLHTDAGVAYVNYWGPCVVPLLYALVPSALAILPVPLSAQEE